MLYGVKCSKCGLMQLPRERCKSCGAALDHQMGHQDRSSVRTPPIPDAQMEHLSIEVDFPQAKEESARSRKVSFHGNGGDLFAIQTVNMLLTIVTLGFYHFWGKVKVRRYLISQAEFEEDRFAYHGTGKELFIGFLKAFLIFFLPMILLEIVPPLLGAGPAILVLAGFLQYLILLIFIAIAMVGARRYRLSRTSWRGVRFSFRGKTWDFMKLFLWGSFLSGITLGLYIPIFDTRRHGFLVSHSYFGSRKFDFDGNGRELFWPFVRALFLTIPTLGLYWFWFMAKKQHYFWEHTSFRGVHFRFPVTGKALLKLSLGNLALLIVTLGLAWPWVITRKMRFALSYLTLEGVLTLGEIVQEALDAKATGEAFSGFFESGFEFEF